MCSSGEDSLLGENQGKGYLIGTKMEAETVNVHRLWSNVTPKLFESGEGLTN